MVHELIISKIMLNSSLTKLLDCLVEGSLFVIVIHQFYWVYSCKVAASNYIFIDTIRSSLLIRCIYVG